IFTGPPPVIGETDEGGATPLRTDVQYVRADVDADRPPRRLPAAVADLGLREKVVMPRSWPRWCCSGSSRRRCWTRSTPPSSAPSRSSVSQTWPRRRPQGRPTPARPPGVTTDALRPAHRLRRARDQLLGALADDRAPRGRL